MTTTMPQRVEDFIGPDILSGYHIKHRRWNDAEWRSMGEMILFKENGIDTPDYVVQKPQVEIHMITDPDRVEAGREVMRLIRRAFLERYKSADVVHFQPIGGISGIQYISGDRGYIRQTVECIVQDQ